MRKLKIFGATIADPQQRRMPGEIIVADDTVLVVAARDGALSLGEVQLEGKRRMRAVDFLRGRT